MLTPILLHAFPRSGSTLMMMLFSCVEGVQFCREYPFEERDLTYMVRLAQLACRHTDRSQRELMLSPLNQLHGYPYQSVTSFFLDSADARRDVFLHLWEGYSRSVEKQGAFTHYAEKVPIDVADFVRPIIPAREIVLIRDPRAVFSSILKFDAKRGFHGFGRIESDDDMAYAARFSALQKQYYSAMRRITDNQKALEIRYETLISNFAAGLSEMESYLERKIDREALELQLAGHIDHTTSKTATSSIDQWRTDLDPTIAALIAENLADEMAHYGYA